ncbi:MAG TPA: cobalamin B12-binding domain-containing protein [Usitatibacter sp.]|jgi:methylmalonyl-CoA mutase C-terminal domain/subunit
MNATTQGAPLRGKRIVVAKPGLDGHDIGAKVIALALRDAGAEVIYTGLRKSPEHIARIAVDEGVDALGLSILSGSHRELVRQVLDELRKLDAADIKVFVGGTIPADDVAELEGLGVRGVYTSEQPLPEVIEKLARALG